MDDDCTKFRLGALVELKYYQGSVLAVILQNPPFLWDRMKVQMIGEPRPEIVKCSDWVLACTHPKN